ncbi:MAG: transglycosylase SLT domain-containing protein [Gammaproteobacteria bacterium]
MRFTSRVYRLCAAATLALLSFTAALGAGSADTNIEARKAFQESLAQVAIGATEPAAEDSTELRAYALYPYLEASRIQQAVRAETGLIGEVDKQAEAFISAYAQDPVARPVRRVWLESLARRALWPAFLGAYRDVESNDALRCQSFIARIETGKIEGLVADMSKQWLAPRSLPDCERPFAWMKDNGVLTTQLIEERSRLALQDGNAAFARQIIQQLPADNAAPLLQWASLIEQPASAIDALIASSDTPVDAQTLLAGWTRLARTDRQAAKERFSDLMHVRAIEGEAASPYALALALALAWDRDPLALEYFDLVAPADLNDAAYEWWVRAALLADKWELASRLIPRMTEASRNTARWRYWAARAAGELHEPGKARRIYESLLPDDNYYSAMAAAHLKRSFAPHPQPLPLDAALLTTIEAVPALERARELFLCGMRPEAFAEWRFGFGALPEGGRQQAIHLAASWGWYEQAIAVASSQRVFFDYALLYPRPYTSEVEAAASQAKLAPDLVYSIVRQESLYRADAVSSAGARGLMQMTPDTARRTARQQKRALPGADDLFDPAINTSLGAAHIRELLDRFDGQLPVALAGYNAGPNAVTRWLPSRKLDSDIWIENIPYNETRTYVQRVLWHEVTFGWLRTKGKAQRTDSWLAQVRPVS